MVRPGGGRFGPLVNVKGKSGWNHAQPQGEYGQSRHQQPGCRRLRIEEPQQRPPEDPGYNAQRVQRGNGNQGSLP